MSKIIKQNQVSAIEERLDFLLAFYVAAIVASEFLGAKTFPIWIFNASVAIFTLPITFCINDIVIEVKGERRAQSFMHSSLRILVFLAILTTVAVLLPASARFAPDNGAYQLIFAKSLRMTIASLIAFWSAAKLDIWVFARVREELKKTRLGQLWFRSNLSNFTAQFFDTTIFMFLAFFNGHNTAFIWSLILPYWLLKCIFSVAATPLTYLGVRWLKGEKSVKNIAGSNSSKGKK